MRLQIFKLEMSVWLQISLLCVIGFASSQILFEELKAPIMHPRTFYLSPNQEFQVISKVLCEDIPCPEFSVIQDYPYFIQQRSYHSSKFLKLTSMRTCNFKSALEDGRQRLENFTKGGNNKEEKYQKTLPFLIQINQITTSKSKNPWCHMSYGANFYVPHYWGNIATPTKFLPEFLDLEENLQVYVYTFDGNVEKVLLKEIELFRKNLDTVNLCYKKMTFYIAIYEVPHSPQDSRLNSFPPLAACIDDAVHVDFESGGVLLSHKYAILMTPSCCVHFSTLSGLILIVVLIFFDAISTGKTD